MNKICYYCCKPIQKSELTREHIPAKNLYADLPEEFKKDLVTVPAHKICNNLFSKIDHIMRDMIGISNNSLSEKVEMTRKSVSSIQRDKKWRKRIIIDENRRLQGVTFDGDLLEMYHVKNFRGLFYHKYQKPLSKEYVVKAIMMDGDTINDADKTMFNMLIDPGKTKEWKHIGHPDVFLYKIKSFRIEHNKLVKAKDMAKAKIIACAMFYHNDKGAVLIAERIGLISSVMTRIRLIKNRMKDPLNLKRKKLPRIVKSR